MTVSLIAPLVDAMKAHLATALEGAGIPEEEGGDAPDIPVATKVTAGADRLQVRLEGFRTLPGNTKYGRADRHDFLVGVTYQELGEVIADPSDELPRVEGLVVAALKGWAPMEAASEIKFRGSFEAEEPDPEHASRVSRFFVNINGE